MKVYITAATGSTVITVISFITVLCVYNFVCFIMFRFVTTTARQIPKNRVDIIWLKILKKGKDD